MADEKKIGTPWKDDELDAIVADYFEMLEAELSGRPYVKSRHSRALMVRIGRTHRSVEFKHQNISAVLDELGMPWIPGYIPKRNYQNAIFDAVDRYLSEHPSVLQRVPHGRRQRRRMRSSFPCLFSRRTARPCLSGSGVWFGSLTLWNAIIGTDRWGRLGRSSS